MIEKRTYSKWISNDSTNISFNKKLFMLLFIVLLSFVSIAQQSNNTKQLKLQLENLSIDVPGLTEKADITVNNVQLPDFLRAIANAHKINLNISPKLKSIIITNNSSNASVADILLFVCKEYNLTIDFTGSIMSIKKIDKPKKELPKRIIPITYNADKDLFSIELQNDSLYIAFKGITDKTGKNLVYAPSIGNYKLSSYIQNMPLESALDKIALANNLSVTKTRDNYYLFEKSQDYLTVSTSAKGDPNRKQKPQRRRRSNFYFQIKDSISKTLDVDFENTAISSIVYDISNELGLNVYTSHPLDEAGVASFKAKDISLDLLLQSLFENTEFTFKKSDDIYFFGKRDQNAVRNSVIIPLQYRSIEIMTGQNGGRRAGKLNNTNNNFSTGNNLRNQNNQNNSNRQNLNTNRQNNFSNYDSKAEALVNILPQDIIKDLEIKTDTELNSFIVSGPSQNVEKFKRFIKGVDKPVPVISIEVMILETNKSATLEAGVSMGIGEEPSKTGGSTFPDANINLGASTINKILQVINGYGSFNLGQVVPEFYANIKALESNGNIKIRSTPRLSTLNGHKANLSIGETTYYVVTNQNYYGSQIPQASEVKNYQPIDAEMAISLKPIVSGDGHITVDITVIQSSFNGKKVDENAPPGINSREFTSIVRVKDGDLIVLGGLEERIKNDAGTGVPFLARIPIIKWFFSKRIREDTKKKLVVLIKPTVIY